MPNNGKCRETDQSLASLPVDILISLTDFLEPLDVIALRKTCRPLYEASHQRIVWIKAFARTCASNCVFLSTYSFNQMSTMALTRAAVDPSRWLSSLRRRQQHLGGHAHAIPIELSVPSSTADTLIPPINLNLPADDEVQMIFLIPGGQFLLILTMHSLSLWFLGYSEVECVERQPLASVKSDHLYNLTISVQPANDKAVVRVVMLSYPVNPLTDKRKQLIAYEIRPASSTPEFVQIAVLSVDSVGPCFSLRLMGDRVVFLDGSLVTVWDFVRNRSVEWNTERHSINNFFVASDTVILLAHQETVVWKIPEPEAFEQKYTPSTTAGNIYSFPSLLNQGEDYKVAYWGCLADWYWSLQEPFFDIFACQSTNNEARSVMMLRCEPAVISSSPTCPSIHCTSSFPHIVKPASGIRSLQYRLCGNDLVACSMSGGSTLYLTVLGAKPAEFVRAAVELKHDMTSITSYSLCPVAGRLCYATDEGEIVVLNLFA